jgi:hypothetical protein
MGFWGSDATETPQLGNGSLPFTTEGGLAAVAEAFLLQKRVSGCSDATIRAYRFWLERLVVEVTDVATLDAVAVTRFFARLRERGVGAWSSA